MPEGNKALVAGLQQIFTNLYIARQYRRLSSSFTAALPLTPFKEY